MLLTIILALIAIIPATTAALVGIRNGKKVDNVSKKADDIHILVNSNLSQVKADLILANQRIKVLEEALLAAKVNIS